MFACILDFCGFDCFVVVLGAGWLVWFGFFLTLVYFFDGGFCLGF